MSDPRPFVVFGATGNMGGNAARVLLSRGHRVRAVTRGPDKPAALALAALGAEVVRADLDDRDSLLRAVDGARGVFSVQNWIEAGAEGEIAQGCRLADCCHEVGVPHVVYGSGGAGTPDSGIPHFDCKLVVEAHMRRLGLPLTILRPVPFMELMTEPQFHPAVGVWWGQRRIVGWDLPIPWIAAADIGTAIANALTDPARWIGRDVLLVGDVRSLGEAHALYVEAFGRAPRKAPLPLWVIGRLAGAELVDMWRWTTGWVESLGGRPGLEAEAARTREILPEPTPLDRWLRGVAAR